MSDFYGAVKLTGGIIGYLDAIDGAQLSDLDGAVVFAARDVSHYILDDDSGAAESVPNVVIPDSNPGTKRWVLANLIAALPTIGDHVATKEYVDLAIGSVLDFFLSDTDDGVVADTHVMYELETGGVESTEVTPSLSQGDAQLLFTWLSEIGRPAASHIREGVYDAHLHLSKSGTKSVTVYWTLSFVDADGSSNEVLVTTSEESPELTAIDTTYDIHAVSSSDVTSGADKRIILRVYGNVGSSGSNPVVTISMEGDTDSHMTIDVPSDIWQLRGDVLDDLNILGAVGANSEMLVGTGTGAFAWEAGATLRTSIGVGTGDSPTLTGLTLSGNLIGPEGFQFGSTSSFWTANEASGYLTTMQRVAVGVVDPGQMFVIGSDDGSNRLELFHTNVHGRIRWDGGNLQFVCTDSANAQTVLDIIPQGTGYGSYRICGITLLRWKTGEVRADIIPGASIDIRYFTSAAEGETPSFQIVGFRTGDSQRRILSITTGKNAANQVTFDGLSNYRFDGNLIIADVGNIGSASDPNAIAIAAGGGVTFSRTIAASNYGAANKLTACATNAGALDFSAASKTLTVDETQTIGNLHTDARAATWLAANHEQTFNHSNFNTAYSHVSADGSSHSIVGSNTTAIGLNTTHRGSNGSNHSYLDQAVTIASTPTFANVILPDGGELKVANGSPSIALDGTNDYVVFTATRFGFNVTPAGLFHLQKDINDNVRAILNNPNAGSGARAEFLIGQDTSINNAIRISAMGPNFTTSGAMMQDGSAISSETGLSGGLSIVTRATAATATIRFYTGGNAAGNKRMEITKDGEVFMFDLASGTTQGGAGAAANELWVDTDDDNTIKLGT